MGVKKSVVCRSRPPPNGMNPASSRVLIPLTKPSCASGASPFRTCSRSPGANLEAQPAFVEYFVSLMRVRSSIAAEYTPPLRPSDQIAPFRRAQPLCRVLVRKGSCLELYSRNICHMADVSVPDIVHHEPAGKTSARWWRLRGLPCRHGHLQRSDPVVQLTTGNL